MEIERQEEKWIVTLAEECTIADVEADTDQLRRLPDDIQGIEVHAQGVRECDTAYLQMLLSLKVTAEHRGTAFSLRSSEALDDLWKLYIS